MRIVRFGGWRADQNAVWQGTCTPFLYKLLSLGNLGLYRQRNNRFYLGRRISAALRTSGNTILWYTTSALKSGQDTEGYSLEKPYGNKDAICV